MIDDVTRRYFVREAAALSPVLYEHLDVAVAASAELPYRAVKYPHAHALHRRAVFRENLERDMLPNGWTVGGNPRRTGQTILEQKDLGATLRVLSESTVTSNGIPHAGSTHARRAAWRSVPLFGPEMLVDRDLLLLLDHREPNPTMRIVHTTEPGRFKGAVACDFAVAMVRDVDVMGAASFDTADEFVDFFVNLEEEESGDA